MSNVITAPWPPEQVEALQVAQACPYWHGYTCEHHSDERLRPTPDGWRCDVPGCAYTQSWAYAPQPAPAGREPHACTSCGMGGALHCSHCTRCV